MAEGTLPRTGLTTFGTDQDQHPNRVKYNAELQKLEDKVALFTQGPTANRPSSGLRGSFFWDETAGKLQYDTGTTWAELVNVGGGGVGRDVTPAVAGTEGVSTKGARADHTHNLPLATTTAHGALSSTDKTKLDNATSAATASRLVIRDAAGRAQFIAPATGADAATKTYVDSMVWDGSDITSGTVSATYLPLASATANGIVTAADKSKLDGATSAATASRLVIRDVNGRAQFAEPGAGADAATKGYVDTQIGGRSAAGHTHPGSDITSLLGAAMLPVVTSTVQGAMLAADKNKLDAAGPTATANTLMMADANGRYQAAAPSGASDVANKGYVDGEVATRALSGHTHGGGDITSVIPAAMIPLATSTTPGAVTAADKNRLDGASSLIQFNQLVLRDAFGRAQFGNPDAIQDAATKGYVDTALGTKSDTGHTHAASAITSGTISASRLPVSSPTAAGTMSASDYNLLNGASINANASTLVLRDSAGRITTQRPTAAAHASDKEYVDDVAAGRVTWAEFDNRITRGATFTYLVSPDGGTAFSCNDNGQIGSTNIYNTAITVGTWRAVYVTSQGILGYSASTRRMKTDEREYTVPLDVLEAVSPKRFKYIADVDQNGDAANEHVNFMAEDLHNAGLTEFVCYDGEGAGEENVETINEGLMVNALWSFAQQQQDLIRGLTDRVKALEEE